jgi:hypothetical protein
MLILSSLDVLAGTVFPARLLPDNVGATPSSSGIGKTMSIMPGAKSGSLDDADADRVRAEVAVGTVDKRVKLDADPREGDDRVDPDRVGKVRGGDACSVLR